MEEKNKKKNISSVIQSVVFVAVTIAAVYGCSYFYMESEYQIIRNVVMAAMGALLTLYIFFASAAARTLNYDNHNHFGRFTVFYYIGLILACIFPVLPYTGWPFIVIFAALALFGNMACGITAGSALLMITVFMMPNAGLDVFMLYFMSGMVTVVLLQNLDESFKVGIPVFLSLLFFMVAETANVVLFINERLNIEMFIIPGINVILSAIMLLALLRIYNDVVAALPDETEETAGDSADFPLQKKDSLNAPEDVVDASLLGPLAGAEAEYQEKGGEQDDEYGADTIKSAEENDKENQYEQSAGGESRFTVYFPEKDGVSNDFSGKDVVLEEPEAENRPEPTAADSDEPADAKKDDYMSKFKFSKDGKRLERCAGGFVPKSSSYNPQSGQCTALFSRSQCSQCPYRNQCRPKTLKNACRKTVSTTAKHHDYQLRDVRKR